MLIFLNERWNINKFHLISHSKSIDVLQPHPKPQPWFFQESSRPFLKTNCEWNPISFPLNPPPPASRAHARHGAWVFLPRRFGSLSGLWWLLIPTITKYRERCSFFKKCVFYSLHLVYFCWFHSLSNFAIRFDWILWGVFGGWGCLLFHIWTQPKRRE